MARQRQVQVNWGELQKYFKSANVIDADLGLSDRESKAFRSADKVSLAFIRRIVDYANRASGDYSRLWTDFVVRSYEPSEMIVDLSYDALRIPSLFVLRLYHDGLIETVVKPTALHLKKAGDVETIKSRYLFDFAGDGCWRDVIRCSLDMCVRLRETVASGGVTSTGEPVRGLMIMRDEFIYYFALSTGDSSVLSPTSDLSGFFNLYEPRRLSNRPLRSCLVSDRPVNFCQ